MRRIRLVQLAVLAVLSVAVHAAPAAAAITLGQLAPGTSPPADCANPAPFDLLQPSVTSGNTYVVPASVPKWTISSWSHNAGTEAGQSIAFKVFRQTSGFTYRVVGHDGPRPITPDQINT